MSLTKIVVEVKVEASSANPLKLWVDQIRKTFINIVEDLKAKQVKQPIPLPLALTLPSSKKNIKTGDKDLKKVEYDNCHKKSPYPNRYPDIKSQN